MNKIEDMYDLIIVGGGPAGLSAGIYMARAKYRVLVIEKEKTGGQITITSELVNYPGVEKASGKELMEHMRKQAEAFGAEFLTAEVLDMKLESDRKELHTTKGVYRSLGVVLAVGANPRKLGFTGEKEFQGRGVAYCATCDGEFFDGMDVFVIGGGFAAVEEGIFLTKYAKHVTLIVREEAFTCAKTVSDKLEGMEKISVHFHTEVKQVEGKDMVEKAIFRDNMTNEEWSYDSREHGAFGIFVFAGYVPNTKWLPKTLKLNEQGYILTDRDQKTSIEGVYAAGDVCVKNLRQVVTAVADGAIAATSAEKHVSHMHEVLHLPEFPVHRAAEPERKSVLGGLPKAEFREHHGFFSQEIREQLSGVFIKFEQPVLLKAWLDESSLSAETAGFLGELTALTDKVSWVKVPEHGELLLPSIEVCSADGKSSGIHFHGVPGGHEINSFIIALYNVAGQGQEIEADIREQVNQIHRKVNLKILVSLSCTMCPETVMAAQKLASISENIEAEMIDLMHFPELRDKYKVMSVPCMVVNEEIVSFGKKGIREVLSVINGK